MKNLTGKTVIILLLLLLSADLFAYSSRKKYFSRPQVGVWFGPVTPILDTSDELEPDLGGGFFFRYNLPLPSLKVGLETSYQKYDSEGVNGIRLVPVFMNFLYLLPINLPVRFQLKAGFGGAHVYMEPDEVGQWDPLATAGLEVSFPAGKMANIALRLDYMQIIERHIEDSTHDGYFFNAGISLYLNLNL